MSWIWEAFGAFEGFTVEAIKFEGTLVMRYFKTLFMAIEGTKMFLLMSFPELAKMRLIVAIPTKYLLLLNTIPIPFINSTRLTSLGLCIPLPNPLRRVIRIQIPILDIILPHVLRGWSEKVSMIVNGYFLFFRWEINGVVILQEVEHVSLRDWSRFVNGEHVLYGEFEEQHAVGFGVACAVL